MVKQHEIRLPRGARPRPKKRVGRGDGSGKGSYSGRGRKGAGARSGAGPRAGFEGWQLPWIKGMPKKRGFKPLTRREFSVVNLARLEAAFEAGAEVTPEKMVQTGLVKDLRLPIKVLGEGELTKPLKVVAHAFSASAREKLQAAGGAAQLLGESAG